MRTIRSFDDALDFYPSADRDHGFSLRRIAKTAQIYWNALCEGLAAAQGYHELTRRGVAHDVAAHRIFSKHFGA